MGFEESRQPTRSQVHASMRGASLNNQYVESEAEGRSMKHLQTARHTSRILAATLLAAALGSPHASAQTPHAHTRTSVLAPTPPMGWNSWDSYGTTVRENEVKANADTMAAKLHQFGWQYIVVDIQWYEPNAQAHGYRPNAKLIMDAYGRLIPAPNRFPSAANGQGFKPLADYVHSKGLKFGIHILRGIPRQAVAENCSHPGHKSARRRCRR